MLKSFIKPVYAHCDIPCGIYETDTLKHAVASCRRMVEGLLDLENNHDEIEGRANFVRMVKVKEKYAQKAKQELYILWSDYFKPEHLEKFPELHDLLWRAAKQSSKLKQTVSLAECEKMEKLVAEVHKIFVESKVK